MTSSKIQTSKNLETEVKSSQVQLLLRSSVQSALGNSLVALVFAFFYYLFTPDVHKLELSFWLFAMGAVSMLRWLHSRQLLAKLGQQPNAPHIQSFISSNKTQQASHLELIQTAPKHSIWILLTAALWGIASVVFFSEDATAQTVLMVSIAGIAAGALSSLSSIKPLFFTFIALILIPLELQLFFSAAEQSQAFALMLLLFVGFIVKSGLQQQQLIVDMLSARFENQQLISELTQAKEQAEEAVSLKSNFLANISHELRTPLNAILGFSNILKQKEADPQKRYYQEVIDESGHHLLNIINDILDLSRIENHQIQIKPHHSNVIQLAKTVVAKHQKSSQQKSIQVITDSAPEVPPSLKFDGKHWQQILSHLLSNAIKFSPEHTKVQIKIAYDTQQQILITQVIDHGIGISKEQQKKILDSFTQVDSSSTRTYGGLGLGLTLCYQLTQLLGGKFSIESTPGKGSRFCFDIQATPVTESPRPVDSSSKRPQLKGHLLIAEDNLTNQLLLKSLLSKQGLTFDVANNGAEAVDYFHQHRYDLILMDENMPKLSGTEATLKIRHFEAENNKTRTPIIAVTANASEADRQKFLDADMDDFIPKPIHVPQLIAALQKTLKHAD